MVGRAAARITQGPRVPGGRGVGCRGLQRGLGRDGMCGEGAWKGGMGKDGDGAVKMRRVMGVGERDG
ncbi:hypothetical protein E2C01_080210 [Portunus trituberculatus]|uniref:Uncharacterized protein n=1 Tax=Portunus trituberculatus TaxID=210409 RepID=A0A5B7IYY8_PORTR|nr:hypothetical protein [Portunus trituberculatus]